MHAFLSVDATYATADTAAINDEDDDSNNVRIPPEVAGTTSKQVTTSVISSAAKLSLCAYFEGENWPLSKALPRGMSS